MISIKPTGEIDQFKSTYNDPLEKQLMKIYKIGTNVGCLPKDFTF